MKFEKQSEYVRKIRELEEELNHLKTSKKYGIVFEEKREDFEERARNALPVLKEVENMRIGSNAEGPTNIVIEGDNYHALSCLRHTHKGKVDVIYIDPPYNTGNKDFIYNDRYVDKEDTYRHSKWLSFMKKRLVLAQELLSESGVIFISIDDNDQAQLKMLCDEVFGEGNFVANITWARKRGKDNSAKYLSRNHEFGLIYSKSIENIVTNRLEMSEDTIAAYSNPDNDERGAYRLIAAWATGQKK
jgi:adenine-specific DNA-methyltransferase